jgi:hypothetical protein
VTHSPNSPTSPSVSILCFSQLDGPASAARCPGTGLGIPSTASGNHAASFLRVRTHIAETRAFLDMQRDHQHQLACVTVRRVVDKQTCGAHNAPKRAISAYVVDPCITIGTFLLQQPGTREPGQLFPDRGPGTKVGRRLGLEDPALRVI